MSTANEPFPLSYCHGGWETIRRLEELFGQRRMDRACVVIDVPTEAMRRFAAEHADGFCEYPDPARRAAFWAEHLAERAAVADDSVPSAYLSEMDQGLYGGLAGGDVRFLCDTKTGWISSMVSPLFARIEDATGLRLDRQHPWWRRYIRQMDCFAAAAAGRFGVSHLIVVDSLNFVFECVGATATYLALLERPEAVRPLIEFAYELNAAVHEAFFEHAPLVAGGTCSNMVGWCRGRIVSESIDPFHMTSARDFETWGREPVERLLARFDGGVLHIHANGRHLLEAAATLKGLKGIYLGDDRGYPTSLSILADLRRRAGDVPLVVRAAYADFLAVLDAGLLAGGVQYHVTGCPDADTANRLMDRVRGQNG